MTQIVISRSPGIVPKINGRAVPWAGPLPGGGYIGATEKLDSAVRNGAKWLATLFGRAVTIRFNSHRESGGAWLKEPERQDCGVGVGAVIKIPERVRRQWRASIRKGPYRRLRDLWRPTERSGVARTVYIVAHFLRDPREADHGTEDHGRYAYWTVDTARAAYALLKRKVDFAKAKGE